VESFVEGVNRTTRKGYRSTINAPNLCRSQIFIGAVRETEMIADPKRKPHQDDGDSDKRRRQEEALDEALKNTFPASDPVSVEQPTTSGRAYRS
jgi:hypothetical protein